MTEIVEHMCDKKTHFTLFMIWIRINLYIVEVGKYIKAGNAIMGRLLSLFMGGITMKANKAKIIDLMCAKDLTQEQLANINPMDSPPGKIR